MSQSVEHFRETHEVDMLRQHPVRKTFHGLSRGRYEPILVMESSQDRRRHDSTALWNAMAVGLTYVQSIG